MDRKECYRLTYSLSEIFGYATVGVEGKGERERKEMGKERGSGGGVDILLRDATAAASRPTVGLNPTLGVANQRIAVSAYRSLLASGTQEINDILRTIRRCDNNYYILLHPFNGLFSGTTRVSRYQEGKTSLDLDEARDDEDLGCQWHQLDHMQTICTSLQTDNHTNTSSFNFYRPDALPDSVKACASTTNRNIS